jgi:hypothetical protein
VGLERWIDVSRKHRELLIRFLIVPANVSRGKTLVRLTKSPDVEYSSANASCANWPTFRKRLKS